MNIYLVKRRVKPLNEKASILRGAFPIDRDGVVDGIAGHAGGDML